MVSVVEVVYLVAFVFGLIMTIVWIILPFALFGIKPILRDLLVEMKRANELLERQRSRSA